MKNLYNRLYRNKALRRPKYIIILILLVCSVTTFAQNSDDEFPELEPLSVDNIADIERIASFETDMPSFTSQISPDGEVMLLLSFSDARFQLWDIPEQEIITDVSFDPDIVVFTIFFSPDSRYFAFSTNDFVRAWDTQTGEVAWSIRSIQGVLRYFAFSPDGETLAYASSGIVENEDDEYVVLWDIEQESEIVRFNHPDVNLFRFSPDGRFLATASTFRGSVYLWDLESAELEDLTPTIVRPESDTSILTFAFAVDNLLVYEISAGSGDRVTVWDAEANQEYAGQIVPERGLPFVAGGRVLGALNNRDMLLFDVVSGSYFTVVPDVMFITLTRDESVIISTTDRESVTFQQLRFGETISTIDCEALCSVSVSDGGKVLAISNFFDEGNRIDIYGVPTNT